jgi:hypothetical protein
MTSPPDRWFSWHVLANRRDTLSASERGRARSVLRLTGAPGAARGGPLRSWAGCWGSDRGRCLQATERSRCIHAASCPCSSPASHSPTASPSQRPPVNAPPDHTRHPIPAIALHNEPYYLSAGSNRSWSALRSSMSPTHHPLAAHAPLKPCPFAAVPARPWRTGQRGTSP